jgi:heme/copper-type cytochrome/quinol oxidase subunit 4
MKTVKITSKKYFDNGKMIIIKKTFNDYEEDKKRDFKLKALIVGFILMVIFGGIIPWITGFCTLITKTFNWIF